MKPHVICHMVSSVDGRILSSRWRPKGALSGGLFERLHDQIGGDAWLVGRVTGQEFAKREAYPKHARQAYPREPWITKRDAAAYGVVLDAEGKIAWGRSDIGGDPIIVVLTEQVSDAHLEGLRAEGVSYFFAGKREVDLALALEFLNRELGIKRLLIEGGGLVNGAALASGEVDKVFLYYAPKIFGQGAVPFIADEALHGKAQCVQRYELHRFGQDFALEGYLRDPYTG